MAPDRDQVEAFKSTRTSSPPTSGKVPTSERSYQTTEQPKGSNGNVFVTLVVLLLTAVVGVGSWWLYQNNQKTQAVIKVSELRILELEKQLSVTGEEMGESAGAMKVRLEKLTQRTEDLWVQMDKLWASAWRRNQADIATLNTKIKTQTAKLANQTKKASANSSLLKSVNQQQTETEFSLGVLTEQMQASQNIKTQLTKIQSSLSSLQSKSLADDKQQIVMASNFTELNATVRKLLKRIESLEVQLNDSPVTN